MSISKCLIIGTIALFSIIGIAAFLKKGADQKVEDSAASAMPSESSVLAMPVKSLPVESVPPSVVKVASKKESKKKPEPALQKPQVGLVPSITSSTIHSTKDDFPVIDRVFQLFSTGTSKLPIVETVTYSSSVPWLKGRPAWIADYATHYNTSRHFIARSLNGTSDYFTQKIFEGSKFNVFRKDKKIQFYLLCDVSRLKMGFYYVDLDTNERVLLKTYPVSLGKLDPQKPSGTLTPLGRYSLGNKVAIYKPGTMGYVADKHIEMIRVFGTRWIPFDQELERTTAPSKGYGLYGAPWVLEDNTGELHEQRQLIGQYDTDGGIRLLSDDLEEIFSIVISKPAFIEIVPNVREAKLPGIEVAAPTR